MADLHLLPPQADCVRRILWQHLPVNTRVLAFGSRATGRGLKPHSDLDLLIESPAALPTATLANLKDALAESSLPFAVDLIESRDCSAEFLARIRSEGWVELSPPPAEHA